MAHLHPLLREAAEERSVMSIIVCCGVYTCMLSITIPPHMDGGKPTIFHSELLPGFNVEWGNFICDTIPYIYVLWTSAI